MHGSAKLSNISRWLQHDGCLAVVFIELLIATFGDIQGDVLKPRIPLFSSSSLRFGLTNVDFFFEIAE